MKNEDWKNEDLCRRIKDGDRKAEELLLLVNEPFIRKIVGSEFYAAGLDNDPVGLEFDDLLQVGRIAMLKSVGTYDQSSGFTFLTYAGNVMRNAMRDAVRSGRSWAGGSKYPFPIYLDEDINTRGEDGEGENMSRHEVITTFDTRNPERVALHHIMLLKMVNRILALPDRERMLLSYHYGCDILEGRTLKETAEHFNLSEIYVQEMENLILMKLREQMNDGKVL